MNGQWTIAHHIAGRRCAEESKNKDEHCTSLRGSTARHVIVIAAWSTPHAPMPPLLAQVLCTAHGYSKPLT